MRILYKIKLYGEKVLDLPILLLGIFSLIACTGTPDKSFKDPLCGLASPIILTGDSTDFYIADYLRDTSILLNFDFPDEISVVQSRIPGVLRLVKSEDLPFLSMAKIHTKSGKFEILIKNFKREKAVIQIPDNNYESVKVRGTLNFWNAQNSNMHKTDSGWVEEFELSPGEYSYLLVIDGTEHTDPTNDLRIDNNVGGQNSLLRVGSYQQQDLPFIITDRRNEGHIHFQSNVPLDGVFAFWQNKQIAIQKEGNALNCEIPEEAKRMERSYIRVTAYNQKGISNDILIPLAKGGVVMDASEIDRHDRHAMILYFMMVDRFKDGNPANNFPVDDPEIHPKANYYGGDIAGVTAMLKEGYFEKIGVNTVWLSPITQNPETAYGLYPEPRTSFSGYHGYWPISSTKIDYRFGTEQELKELIGIVHQNDMNILLDYVANHVHELHPVYLQHPDWATSLYLPDGTLNTEKWDEYRLTTWFDTFLPTLDLRREEIVEPMTDSALYWIKEFGIDGFRHDATKHVDELYWRTLTRKLKDFSNCNPLPWQIGETYGSPELIASYIGSGMLDAQFDFNVYDNAIAVFGREKESFARLQAVLNESLRYYGYHNQMGNITGNQDRPRFISLAGGSLRFSEDSKYAGWNREIEVGDPSGYDKLRLLHAFNMTIPGIPVIYYGDEIGIPGGNDPDNRRWMKFENLSEQETETRETVAKLAALRTKSMPLLYGDLQFVHMTETSWVFLRSYFHQQVWVIFNRDTQPQTIEFSHESLEGSELQPFGENEFSRAGKTLTISLPPYSFEILMTN